MNQTVEIGSVVMIYIPSFVKIGSSIQKLVGENPDRMQTAISNIRKRQDSTN
jgi:hypothetical protein